MRIVIFYKGYETKEYIAIVEDTFVKNTDSCHARSTVSGTHIVQKLGLTRDLMAEKNMTRQEVIAWARQCAAQLRNEKKQRIREEKQKQKELQKQESEIKSVKEEPVGAILNCGYLYLFPPLARLRFDLICRKLRSLDHIDYELHDIIRHLVVSLVIRPHSDPLNNRFSRTYVQRSVFEKNTVQAVYNDIAMAADQLRTELYLNLKEQLPRQTEIMYFGCVDVGFQKNGMKLGLYLDEFGYPLGYFCIRNSFDLKPFIHPQASLIAQSLSLDRDIPVIDLSDDNPGDSEIRKQMSEALAFMHDSCVIDHLHDHGNHYMHGFLVICYIAYMVLRSLQADLQERYTIEEIIQTLRNMKVRRRSLQSGNIPAFTQNEITDALAETYGFRFDHFLSPQQMNDNIRFASRVYDTPPRKKAQKNKAD